MGEDQARQMATAQPVLLQIRSKALLSNYRVLENALGFEKTIQARCAALRCHVLPLLYIRACALRVQLRRGRLSSQ